MRLIMKYFFRNLGGVIFGKPSRTCATVLALFFFIPFLLFTSPLSLSRHTVKNEPNPTCIAYDRNDEGLRDSRHIQRNDSSTGWRIAASSMARDEVREAYAQRLFQAKNSCFRTKSGQVRRIMADNDKKLAYCVIPKVGCTFWINVFRYITNQTGGVEVHSPFDIPRWMTHYAERQKEYSINNVKTAPEFLRDAFRFMFVRDPYKRLWAVWIDKFLQPDYWFTAGEVIAIEMGLGNDTVKCPVNITFEHFIGYIATEFTAYYPHFPEGINEHWAPYHILCDPCLFHPHFIGKMETFEADSRFVMESANLRLGEQDDAQKAVLKTGENNSTKEIIKSQFGAKNHNSMYTMLVTMVKANRYAMILHTQDEHIMNEMDMLIEYTLKDVWWSHLKKIIACATKNFLAQRLWLSFQFNGYIPRDCPFRLADGKVEGLARALLDAYTTWDPRPAVRRQAQQRQKRSFMQQAYQSIPLDMMKKIQTMFMPDFKQFGYDPEPISLFKRVTNTA